MPSKKEFDFYRNKKKYKSLSNEDYLKNIEYDKKYDNLLNDFNSKVEALKKTYNCKQIYLSSNVHEYIYRKKLIMQWQLISGSIWSISTVLILYLNIKNSGLTNLNKKGAIIFVLIGLLNLVFGIKNFIKLRKLK